MNDVVHEVPVDSSAVDKLLALVHQSSPDFRAIEAIAKELQAELRKLGPAGDAVREKLMQLGGHIDRWTKEHDVRWTANEPGALRWI